ncbi:MAG TPA: hypothetical protein VII02_03190, partial [Gemmatimonadaceae bacterium]
MARHTGAAVGDRAALESGSGGEAFVAMTRGWGCDGSLRALRNRRLAAAAASRNADSRKSIV